MFPPCDDRYIFYQCYLAENSFAYQELKPDDKYKPVDNSRLLFVNKHIPRVFHKMKLYWDFLPKY